MIGGILLVLGIIALVFVHELGHFLAAKQAGIKVEEFGFGFPPRIVGWRRGETLYSINWLPIGGFVRIYGESKQRMTERASETGEAIAEERTFYAQSLWRRFVVIAAGISINFIVAWLLLSLTLMIGVRESVVVSAIQPGSPAETIGLQVGDELVGFSTAESFVQFTNAHQGITADVTVLRSGASHTFSPILRQMKPGEAPLGAAVSKTGFASLSFFSALGHGFIDAVVGAGEIFKAFGALITGIFVHASVPANIMGPVGIFGIAGELSALSFVYLLQLLGMISLNLAILNAIPFPALDGGRILFLVIEKIKGSPLHPGREMWANLISFGLLVVLMLVITGRDIIRLL